MNFVNNRYITLGMLKEQDRSTYASLFEVFMKRDLLKKEQTLITDELKALKEYGIVVEGIDKFEFNEKTQKIEFVKTLNITADNPPTGVVINQNIDFYKLKGYVNFKKTIEKYLAITLPRIDYSKRWFGDLAERIIYAIRDHNILSEKYDLNEPLNNSLIQINLENFLKNNQDKEINQKNILNTVNMLQNFENHRVNKFFDKMKEFLNKKISGEVICRESEFINRDVLYDTLKKEIVEISSI